MAVVSRTFGGETMGRPWASHRCLIYLRKQVEYMVGLKGKGSQKNARLERLKSEIATYIEDRPGCSAADIVAYLSNERKMRNHGLTARKIGYFIPRHMKNIIGFKLDATTGKRIYHAMG